MSGINKLKKKTKLSMNEMYDNQSVGELDNQKESKMEVNQSGQPDNQLANKLLIQEDSYLLSNKDEHPIINQSGNITNKQSVQVKKQIMKKSPTYKMTFNLKEDIYKSFNDLYAKRMLKGCKTEKSEMICEAIQWLIQMEENSNK